MKLKCVMATTHVDRQNMRLTKEALESAARDINGPEAAAVGLEHDPAMPPLGKLVKAEIEQLEDGEYQLIGIQELFEEQRPIQLPNGTRLIQQFSSSDTRPFIGSTAVPPELISVNYDPVNFEIEGGQEDGFLREVAESGNCKTRHLIRKSLLPDPELVIILGKAFVSIVFIRATLETAKKTADKLSDKISEDLAAAYTLIKSAMVSAAKRMIPKERPITYVFDLNGQPSVELVARTRNVDLVLSALRIEPVVDAVLQSLELGKLLGAAKVQFLLGEDGSWKLNYLLTQRGEVIGTPASFSRRAERLKLFGRQSSS